MTRRGHATRASATCQCTGPEPAIHPHPADPTKRVCRDCVDQIQMAMDQPGLQARKRIGDVGERERIGRNAPLYRDPGANLQRVVEQLRGGGSVFVVDGAGGIHSLSAEAYAALPASHLEGSVVRLTREAAEEVAKAKKSTGAQETKAPIGTTTKRERNS